MQRYARGMSNGGVVQSRGTDPLSNHELKAVVPSLFATEAHESRSHRFVPIPTITVLDGLRREGFEPFFAQQARTRVAGKAEFTKHMVRLRHRGLRNDRDEAFEVILLNANDGTAAYNLIPGFFRFVCANGLFAGESFETVKVRHSGNAVDEVIEGTCRVLDEAPALIDARNQMVGTSLSTGEAEAFARAAHQLRFPGAYPSVQGETDHLTEDELAEAMEVKPAPIEPGDLLRLRRYEDRSANRNLWTVFNTVQENAIKGGQTGWVTGRNGRRRRSTTREVRGIDQNTALNRALWTLAEEMQALKNAA